MTKRSVAVRISGQEYRLRSEADEAWLQQVAGCVDRAMTQIRERTGTVDSLDVAILTSLNLAREVLQLREEARPAAGDIDARMRDLIELAESTLRDPDGDSTERWERAATGGHDLGDGDVALGRGESLLGPEIDEIEVAAASSAPDRAPRESAFEGSEAGS